MCEDVFEPRGGLRLHAQDYISVAPWGARSSRLQFTWVSSAQRLEAVTLLFLMFFLTKMGENTCVWLYKNDVPRCAVNNLFEG